MIDPAGFNKVVVLTGCSSGIGLQTLLLFLSHQYKVFGMDVNQFDYSVLEKFEGGRYQEYFHFHQADLMKQKDIEESINICVEKWGPKIDVLINNAGIIDSFSSAATYTDVEFDRVMTINLTAPMQLMRLVLPHMLPQNSGRIINVCSRASTSGATAGVAYTASKHALLGATKHTAWRYKDEGITCNAVMPGSVGTNISASMGGNLDMESLGTLQLMHKMNVIKGREFAVQSKDVAEAILFLAGEGAQSISGVALPVDMAWSAV